jgi:hypothetical protein
MIFWLGILTGGLFAWLGFKIGFYQMWATLFNIVIAVYLAVFFGPVILDIIPGVSDTAYSLVLAVTSTGIATFLILQILSYTFLTGQFDFSIPRLVDIPGSVLLGFLAGFLVWSFAALLIWLAPISHNTVFRKVGFGGTSQQTNMSNIYWWCNLVNMAVSSDEQSRTAQETVDELISRAKPQPAQTGEPNEPDKSKEPAETAVENRGVSGSTDERSTSHVTGSFAGDG